MKYVDYIIPGLVVYGLAYLYTRQLPNLNPLDPNNSVIDGTNQIGDRIDDGVVNNSFDWNREWYLFWNPSKRVDVIERETHVMPDGTIMAGATHATGGY
jgi:hypothetical protein